MVGPVLHVVPAWLDKCIDGVKNKIWLENKPTAGEAICKVCKTSSDEKKIIKICEGYTAITKHADGVKHKANISKVQTDPNHNLFEPNPEQIPLEQAFENARKKTKENDERKVILI